MRTDRGTLILSAAEVETRKRLSKSIATITAAGKTLEEDFAPYSSPDQKPGWVWQPPKLSDEVTRAVELLHQAKAVLAALLADDKLLANDKS
jgi:hypothetical protein